MVKVRTGSFGDLDTGGYRCNRRSCKAELPVLVHSPHTCTTAAMVSFVEPSQTRPSTSTSSMSSHSHDDSYLPPQAPPIKQYSDNVMIDVTMDDDEELYDSYDYPREVPGIDPKLQPTVSSHHGIRRRMRWCGWMPLCLVVGWIATIVLAAQLFVVRHNYREFRSQLEVLFPDDDSKNEDEVYDVNAFALRINTGSSRSYNDNKGRVWLTDAYDLGDDNVTDVRSIQDETMFTVRGDGYLYDTTVESPDTIITEISNSGVEGQGLYRDERYFTTYGAYEIPVPKINNWYRIDMFFCEFYYEEVGERTFNLYVDGAWIRNGYDILSETGGEMFTAVVVSHSVYVRASTILIELRSVRNEAKISGIQVQDLY
jgi:Malectin domain